MIEIPIKEAIALYDECNKFYTTELSISETSPLRRKAIEIFNNDRFTAMLSVCVLVFYSIAKEYEQIW